MNIYNSDFNCRFLSTYFLPRGPNKCLIENEFTNFYMQTNMLKDTSFDLLWQYILKYVIDCSLQKRMIIYTLLV